MKIVTTGALAALTALTAGLPALAQPAYQAALDSYVEGLRADCASLENGTLDFGEEAIDHSVDVNGDGVADPILEAATATACSTSATFSSGGTGGGAISVFVSDPEAATTRYEFLGHGIQPVTMGDRTVLVVSKHPSSCDLDTVAPCFAAYSWTGTGFTSAGDSVGPAGN